MNKFERFFLKPASPLPLSVLRILLSGLLLVQAYLLRDWLEPFLSRDGLIQGALADALRNPLLPHVGWFADWLAPLGISELTTLYMVGALYVGSLVLLFLGLFTRTAAVATWLLHWIFVTTGYTSAYGVDMYAHAILFYLMFVPCGEALSLDSHFAGRPQVGLPSQAARLGIRALQLHLCISYFFSAYEKVQGVQWRTGDVLYRMFNLPFYNYIDMHWIASWPSLLMIGAWATILFEGAFFIFIWPRSIRPYWVAAMVGLHASIAIFMGLYLFGAIMCLLVTSIFAIPAEAPNSTKDEELLPV